MSKRLAEVDAYIAHAQPFARPILKKIRSLFHRAYPNIEETMKWRMPCFEHKGIVGIMAGFKQHASWRLWRSGLLNDPHRVLAGNSNSPKGDGKLTDISQLPPDKVMLDLIKQMVALNERGIKKPARPRTSRPKPKVPADLVAMLKKNAKAATVFKAFSPSHQREYIDWITEAKKPETRQRRLAQTIELLARGKSRNWKYEKC